MRVGTLLLIELPARGAMENEKVRRRAHIRSFVKLVAERREVRVARLEIEQVAVGGERDPKPVPRGERRPPPLLQNRLALQDALAEHVARAHRADAHAAAAAVVAVRRAGAGRGAGARRAVTGCARARGSRRRGGDGRDRRRGRTSAHYSASARFLAEVGVLFDARLTECCDKRAAKRRQRGRQRDARWTCGRRGGRDGAGERTGGHQRWVLVLPA